MLFKALQAKATEPLARIVKSLSAWQAKLAEVWDYERVTSRILFSKSAADETLNLLSGK